MAKKERIINVDPYKAVDYNPAAIAKLVNPVYAVKVDGMRFIAYFDKDTWDFHIVTREGIEITSLRESKNHAVRALQAGLFSYRPYEPLGTYAVDGEVWIQGMDFDTASGILRRDTPVPADLSVVFTVFEVLPLAVITGESTCDAPWQLRRCWVREFEDTADSSSVEAEYILCDHTEDEAFADARERGFEGLIIKDRYGLYRNGKVSGWYKRKDEISEDGVVVGFVPGTNSNTGKLVGFEVELESGVRVKATGLTKEFIQELTENSQKYLGRYVEVKAMQRTAKGALRHPRFSRFRDLDNAPGVKA